MPARFPAPWRVLQHNESFEVQDASGYGLVFIYFRDRPATIGTGHERMTRDQARRIAANIAKLPELLART